MPCGRGGGIGTPCAGAGSIDEMLSCRVNGLASLISSLGNSPLKKVQSSPNEEGEFFADALDRRNFPTGRR